MNPNDVLDAYVADVIRRVPANQRSELGLELRGLLAESLADRAQSQARPADDALVLALLREFGTPAEVAARYLPPGTIIIPADQTRSFALLSLAGVGLQWALTLPRVFAGEQHLSAWWLTWGLGALWWPGFMAMMALAATGLRQMGWFTPTWRPRIVDPDRVSRGLLGFGLAWYAIGVTLMVCLPWLVPVMPGALPQVFAFDPAFLHDRAWPALLLWAVDFALLAFVLGQGRWSPRLRQLDLAFTMAWLALLCWWLATGDFFLAEPSNDGARGAIALLVVIVVLDLAVKLHRRRTAIRLPSLVG